MSEKAKLTGNYFGTIYLTVISLLQGVALSQLVPNIIKYLEEVQDPLSDAHLIPLILMLLIIFIVWHHYAIGIFFLRWFPNIIDTLIPFMISIGEFFLISYLEMENGLENIDVIKWTLGYSIFFLLGSAGYFGAALRNDPDYFLNLMTKQDAEKHIARSRRYYSIGGYSILIQSLFGFLIVLVENENLLWVSLVLFLLHLVLSEHFLMRNIKPPFIKALDDFDASRKSPVDDD